MEREREREGGEREGEGLLVCGKWHLPSLLVQVLHHHECHSVLDPASRDSHMTNSEIT